MGRANLCVVKGSSGLRSTRISKREGRTSAALPFDIGHESWSYMDSLGTWIDSRNLNRCHAGWPRLAWLLSYRRWWNTCLIYAIWGLDHQIALWLSRLRSRMLEAGRRMGEMASVRYFLPRGECGVPQETKTVLGNSRTTLCISSFSMCLRNGYFLTPLYQAYPLPRTQGYHHQHWLAFRISWRLPQFHTRPRVVGVSAGYDLPQRALRLVLHQLPQPDYHR